MTGNTHRAEFCIDKLYNPDSSSGRLGLVEMRAFEMPPHAQMSLAQQLLIRGLVARFWENPVAGKLIPWGTDLHDRFMLPHFVDMDFRDVIDDMRRDGYAFQIDWFAPHFEFRFPQIGTVTVGAIELELRQAIEPWHILGEEATSSGTARYVDSSLERLEVKVRGLTEGRQVRDLQRPPRSLCTRRERAASPSRESATAPGNPPRACTRPFRSTHLWFSISGTPG